MIYLIKLALLDWCFRYEGGCPPDYAEDIIAEGAVFLYIVDALDHEIFRRFGVTPLMPYLQKKDFY